MKNKVYIFDTTLRDGEQAPGASMSKKEKLEIALNLEKLSVDIIEAGFPASSNEDFLAVKDISTRLKKSKIAVLARSNRNDIDKCVQAINNPDRSRIHTFISTSPLHVKFKLKMSFEDVLTSIKTNVEYARGFCPEVEWSSEDATRTDFDFLCKCIESAINSGARVITIADTVGYTTPDEFYDLIKKIFNNVTNIDKAIFSVHCHNDLGLSVANSLAALKAGARQVHCTINGIGERAGNASLEEIVMAIKTRNKIYDFQLDINTQHLAKISKLVEKVTGFTVPPNKAIVGQNAFAHESGIHQHGVIINSSTYEIINPKEVGISASSLVIGKHSGKHALKEKVKDLGFNLDGINFDILLKKVKDFSLKNKKISDEDIINLIND